MPKYQFSVDVRPQYLADQSDPLQDIYSFAYTITITNAGDIPAQLMARHWTICDANGHTEEVKGLGVVGQQPLLQPGESFQYTSGCRLRTPSGTMHGRYFCIAEDTQHFEASIDLFVLEASHDNSSSMPSGRVLH